MLGEWMDELVAVATNQGLASWHVVGTFYIGWIKVKNNGVEEGLSFLRSALAANTITRGRRGGPILSFSWPRHESLPDSLKRR